jgi:hypothetical protein
LMVNSPAGTATVANAPPKLYPPITSQDPQIANPASNT